VASFANLASALEDVVTITPAQAAELGMIVRAKASGPDAVTVVLEFPTTGELKNHAGVGLTMEDGRKVIFSTRMREERTPDGHVIVSFSADRARLDQIKLKVASQGDGLTRIGRVLPMKDFIRLDQLR
jgi:hypothetical protein